MRTAFVIAAGLAAFLLATSPASAAICGTPDAITRNLDGKVFQVYAAPGGTWTMVIIGKDGLACLACLVAVGHGWQNFPLPAKKEKA